MISVTFLDVAEVFSLLKVKLNLKNRKMNFFTDDFKDHVFKGTPISDCFKMKMAL